MQLSEGVVYSIITYNFWLLLQHSARVHVLAKDCDTSGKEHDAKSNDFRRG